VTWRADGPQGNESAKVRWELVPYMSGRVLDLGCGPYKTFPHFIGVDNGHHDAAFGWQNKADIIVPSCEKLDLFADESCDMVFSSHLLEHIPYENVQATLTEWMRVLKRGGHLALYLPDEDEYPKVGHPHANPDHKWNVNYDKVVAALEKVNCDWDMLEFERRNQTDEYSLFFIVKKL
jgi:predicted SAM-dependent methyltransferase